MAITGTQFWTQFLTLLEGGKMTSDPKYYLPAEGGGAQEGEWGNVITQLFNRTAAGSAERKQAVDLLKQAGFWADTDDLNFWVNQDINSADVQDLVNAAEERMPTLFGPDGTASTSGIKPEGATETIPGVMGGGTLTRINRGGGQEPLWAMVYTVGGVQHIYTFSSLESMQAQLGKDAFTSGKYKIGEPLTEDQIKNSDKMWILGEAESFAGQGGQTYQQYFDDIMYEAGLEAGIRNPGKIGEYLSDPEIQRIIAMGEAGGWSEDRIQAEVRNTDYYLNKLYPGIETILKSGIAGENPEAYYYQYMDSVEGSLSALGYDRDADGSFRSKIGELLTAGISSDDFNRFTPTFIRAEQSQEYASALNAWTERDLGKTLDFEDWFDVLAGESSAEISAVVEKATIQFQAERSNTSLSAEQISRLAELTEFSEGQLASAFSNAEQALLAVGQADLERYGLSQESLVNAAFGVETGSMTAVEVQRQARKAATELGIQDDEKAQFFVGFNRQGAPVRGGLAATAPEAG